MRTYKIVKVEWEDSASYTGWSKKGKAKEYKPMSCISCGILVKTSKGSIGVTHSVNEGDIDNTMVIPRKTIKKIETVGKFKA